MNVYNKRTATKLLNMKNKKTDVLHITTRGVVKGHREGHVRAACSGREGEFQTQKVESFSCPKRRVEQGSAFLLP